MKVKAPHKITVALRMAGIAGQDKLNGIFEHLSEGYRWQLSIFRTANEFTGETVRREIERGTEGFIVGIPDTDDALRVLANSEIPTVVLNVSGGGIEKRRTNIAFVQSDSEVIGRSAARELLKQGVYKCFGYAGYRIDEDWSRDRGIYFSDELKKVGHDCKMFDLSHFADKINNLATLTDWLEKLPKPCGILASCDDRAFEILNACREANIRVPAEIGILGINNDPILCENTEPRLSSVQPDFIQEGRLAADILGRMLASASYRRAQCGRFYRVGVRQIVHRDSTHPLSEAGILIQKALAYIEKNATKGIGVQDVARHLKISYSLLNLRFKELLQTSVYEMILKVRLEAVEARLKSSADSLELIAEKCGWNSPASLKKIFKERFKMSMRSYRKVSLSD
jgi:LacI family transcriptional regulator